MNAKPQQPHPTFAPVAATDFEEMAALRVAAMRASLEGLGRFDLARARELLRNSFYPEHSKHIIFEDKKVGFYTL